MRIWFCWISLVCIFPLASLSQENYEIQVYGSQTLGKDSTMIELHSNYSLSGIGAQKGMVSTNHMLRETIEITHGFTPWFEVGFYIFNAIGDNARSNYVGSHIRPRVMAPQKWRWPVGVSISFEGGFVRDGYDPDTWSLEIRPIIDKQYGRLYLAINPVFDISFKGADAGHGLSFAPDFKASYLIGYIFAPGIEYYASVGPPSKPEIFSLQQHQLFVTVDADFNPLWEFNAGYGIGLTSATDRSIFKVIVGRRIGGGRHADNVVGKTKIAGL